MAKYQSSFKDKLIYVFRINDKQHNDCLKIGEATIPDDVMGAQPNSTELNKAAKERINDYTRTAGISYDLLYTEATFYKENGIIKSFSDSEVHDVLKRSGYEKKIFNTEAKADEWYVVDLETVKNAIKAVKEGRESLKNSEKSKDKNPIIFRPEQRDSIEKTKKQFKKGNVMLWFAKMRFGKTLSALQVLKDLDFTRTLILTHRPVVDIGWFEDFEKIFYDKPNFFYGSKKNGDFFQTLEKQLKKKNSKYIYFASMQDLRGSAQVGGNFDKNNDIFSAKWDFIIVDEAHEGTQTELGQNVMHELVKSTTKVLQLSGTPFNLLDNYKEEEIYTWDYVMEQKAKKEWDKTHMGDPNPYLTLPRLNIFTYDLGKLISKFIDEDLAFNFREFFRINKDGELLHEKDVSSFLNLICKEDNGSNYPYSSKEYRNNFRHSLWMVPGVKEAKALSSLLQSHPVFGQFKIVNVAGDGDEEEAKEESLKKVKNAISSKPHETYTITISCGRLTTGVSVPAWTAVFMLSGSFNTSASSYMQTIFRVQTPALINGRIKEECFVFDFAPDRTLRVIAETAKISSKAGKTSSSDRETMGEFLNFCPIISVDGSRMAAYNVEGMLEQLKKVYVERVVRNGFEDGYLYNNDQLMKLDDVELKDFDKLKGIIGSTKAMPKSGDIDINRQGFTDEEYEELEGAEKKSKGKKELSEEEKRLLKEREEKRKNRDSAVSILRGISIRMPLLIYGADVKDEDKQINIENFTELIDEKSWDEFMPKGVTKQVFESFKKYYEPDVFRAAGKRIRAMARAADNLTVEERIARITTIFSTFRNPDKETVLTPWRVVNMHLGDCLGGYVFFDETMEKPQEQPRFVNHEEVTKNVFSEDSKILEINSKSGLYPLFMAYGIYKNILKVKFPKKDTIPSIDAQQKIWDKVVAENIFVLCKTPMAKSITKRTLIGFREAKVNTRYFEDLVNQISNKQQNFLDKVKQGKTYWKSNNNDNMKFNAIVGNPPYQDTGGAGGNNDAPIFQHFCRIASKVSAKYSSLVIPSRWFAAGRENLLAEFRKEMLNSGQVEKLIVFSDSSKLFSNVEIKGGVCYYLENKNHEGKCKYILHRDNLVQENEISLNAFDILIREPKLSSIVEKVEEVRNKLELSTVDKIISSDTPFGIPSNPKESKKTPFKVYSNTSIEHNTLLYHIEKGVRKIEFVKLSEIVKNKNDVNKFKVFVTGAGGSGNDPKVMGDPEYAPRNSVCSQSYLYSAFNTEEEAKCFIKYIKTRFFRVLVSAMKITQSAPSKVYKFVPLEKLNSSSDIDWSKSIPEINKQLYKKYGFTKEEIGFIESMIKPMG
jgi:hypothetical protein